MACFELCHILCRNTPPGIPTVSLSLNASRLRLRSLSADSPSWAPRKVAAGKGLYCFPQLVGSPRWHTWNNILNTMIERSSIQQIPAGISCDITIHSSTPCRPVASQPLHPQEVSILHVDWDISVRAFIVYRGVEERACFRTNPTTVQRIWLRCEFGYLFRVMV